MTSSVWKVMGSILVVTQINILTCADKYGVPSLYKNSDKVLQRSLVTEVPWLLLQNPLLLPSAKWHLYGSLDLLKYN